VLITCWRRGIWPQCREARTNLAGIQSPFNFLYGGIPMLGVGQTSCTGM